MKKKTQSFKALVYGDMWDLPSDESFSNCCGARFHARAVFGSGHGIAMFPEATTFSGTLEENESHYKVPTRNGVIQFVVRDKK